MARLGPSIAGCAIRAHAARPESQAVNRKGTPKSSKSSCKDDRHLIVAAETSSAARTLSRTIRDQILNARMTKDVAAELEHGVANVGVADRANGDFL